MFPCVTRVHVAACAAALALTACAAPAPNSMAPAADIAVGKPALADTTWRMMKLQAANDQAIYPPDPSSFLLTFKAGGQLIARVDCNHGGGTWSSSGPGKIDFGPLTLTKIGCPNPGLGDRFTRDLPDVKNYATRDGRLYLSTTRDGTIYAFEPVQ